MNTLRKFVLSRLSETARSLLWLWENDPRGWKVGHYHAYHLGARVGVWICNRAYGLHAACNCDPSQMLDDHISGRKVTLGWIDRQVLYRVIGKGAYRRQECLIPEAISGWALEGDHYLKKLAALDRFTA